MDATTVTSGIDSTTTLAVAFLAMLGVTVPPIVVALINRSGKADPSDAPNIDLIDDLDHINERLGRENQHLSRQIETLTRENEQLRMQLRTDRYIHGREQEQ